MSLIPFVGAVQKFNRQRAGYQIERSLRFNSADTAYLSRTLTTPTNNKKWTYSCWLKRTGFLTTAFDFALLTSATNAGALGISGTGAFGASLNGKFFITTVGGTYSYVNVEFRDPSAWYHFVMVVDTDNATANDRQILYVNGVRQPNFTSTFSSGAAPLLNTARAHFIGGYAGGFATPAAGYYANGYLTEINFIDGSALTPTSFGEFNPITGVWGPIAYTGTYGTNGFFLNFSDNSTIDALGTDFSGNGNTWDDNGFSVTAGAGNDSLVDTCTLFGTDTGIGGEVRGNYCTWNPLRTGANMVPTNGNLDVVTSATVAQTSSATFGISSGKWYWEVTNSGGSLSYTGIVDLNHEMSTYIGGASNGNGYAYNTSGEKVGPTSGTTAAYGAIYTSSDVIGVALDMDAGTLVFYKNGVSQGTAFSSLTGTWFPAVSGNGVAGKGGTLNAGQRPFAYTAPSGFQALCTQNLPDPTIEDGSEYFNTILYTGTGASNARTGVGFQPDWVWIKERNAAADHGLYDAVRGVQNQLESNTTTAETAEATGLTAFGADGFTVGALAQLNTSADTYVAWNWNAGGSNATNTDGTITSTVRANPTAGFSIVTYTGTGSAATIGHGLGAVPAMIIVKNRDQADAWQVYHKNNTAAPETDYLVLNTTAATADAADRWNDTAPTSSVFSIGNGVEVNTNTEDYVAYCFAEIPGYSAFGSYTGNGSNDGPFIFTNFRPAFILMKSTSAAEQWNIWDSSRIGFNPANHFLGAQSSNAEDTTLSGSNSNGGPDFLSNGFKMRSSGGSSNTSGGTYIFMAFAENPFKFALAR